MPQEKRTQKSHSEEIEEDTQKESAFPRKSRAMTPEPDGLFHTSLPETESQQMSQQNDRKSRSKGGKAEGGERLQAAESSLW